MSSLAATQADGYYVPPDYYESGQYKRKSKNQLAGSKGHNQYLQKGLVRFELPYDGFCLGCNEHVGKGTRFNAHKKEAGNYFTTTIWEFRMKCRVCNTVDFVIRTNPKERGFDYVSGIHRQVQEFDTKDAGTAGFIDTEHGNKIVTEGTTAGEASFSSLSRLETRASGKRKVMTEQDQLRETIKVNSRTYFDDAASNAGLRASFRIERRGRKRRLKEATARGWRQGMQLSDETQEDLATARSMTFRDGKHTERKRFHNLRTSSIFGGAEKETKRRRGSTRDVGTSNLPLPDRAVSSMSAHPIKQEPDKSKREVRTRRISINSESRASRGVVTASLVNSKEPHLATSLGALVDYGSDSSSS